MIANVMENSGLQTYHQNFTVHMPFAGIMEPPSSMGVNIYGILRAPRIAGTEAVVISVPYDQGNNKGALALMLAFADHCRSKFKISLSSEPCLKQKIRDCLLSRFGTVLRFKSV